MIPMRPQTFCDVLACMEDLLTQLMAAESRMTDLLKNIAIDKTPCRGCHAPMIWVNHANGKRTPYDPDGTNHFITCPNRDDFKKKKEHHATTGTGTEPR